MKAKAKESMKFECQLNNVLYIPNLTSNLLSMNAITNNERTVIFTRNKVFVKHKGQLVLKGTKTDKGLYEVKKNERDITSN